MITLAEYSAIDNKWYGNVPVYENFRYLIYLFIGGVAVVLVLVLWNTLLRKKVKERTSELSSAVEELKQSKNRLNAILIAVPDMFFLLDHNDVFIGYQGSGKSALYEDPGMFLGKRIDDIFPPELSIKFHSAIKRLLETGELQTEEYQLEVQQEKLFYEARMALCGNDTVVGIVKDITDRKKIEEYMIKASTVDSLTGLCTRNYFEDHIVGQQAMGIESIGMIMCDLDGLKLVNDTLGHSMGDQYLIAVARRL